jgi:lysophospholipase L1-like esterase
MHRRITALAALLVAATSLSAVTAQELKVGHLKADKVLFLGNSITLHGPAPKIGWDGNWGMAASSRERDYVHLLLSRIAKAAGGEPEASIKNIADFERQLGGFNIKNGLKDELAFEADLIVIAIGENVSALETDEAKANFKAAFTSLLSELKQHGKPTIFVRSNFWADPAKDLILKSVCEKAGGIFVDNSKLSSDDSNFARSERKIEHDGVAAHPGDRGMKAIADALWQAIEKEAKSERK